MSLEKMIQGFSGLTPEEKIKITAEYAADPDEFAREMRLHWHNDHTMQERYNEFTENAVSNFYLPYSLAPNFKINGKDYIVPMVTDESSVVAAASAAAKFWWSNGGFVTKVREMLKPGHVHFIWKGKHAEIEAFVSDVLPGLYAATIVIEKSMRARGGGIKSINLKDLSCKIDGYYQLEVLFNTMDAMGANFINASLECMADYLKQQAELRGMKDKLEIVMSILSNYTPQCLVECQVTCSVEKLAHPPSGMTGELFAKRFNTAILMAGHDVSRAVTNNKGIYNGIDAVLIATGNDFRAVEAAGHAFASRDGNYKGLTHAEIRAGIFTCILEMPIPLGVVGGLTKLHPLAKASLQLLGNPGAETLMSIAASVGMANHYSAIKALITGGIQHGHMRLHLVNLLNQLGASKPEKELAMQHFTNKGFTYATVRTFIDERRKSDKAEEK